jgi:hypothetical protein
MVTMPPTPWSGSRPSREGSEVGALGCGDDGGAVVPGGAQVAPEVLRVVWEIPDGGFSAERPRGVVDREVDFRPEGVAGGPFLKGEDRGWVR